MSFLNPSNWLQWAAPGRYFVSPAIDNNEKMKAVMYDDNGSSSVLSIRDTYRPRPNNDQLLIKVCSTCVNPIDCKLRKHPIAGMILPKPKIPGTDVAGIVVSAPENSGFAVGDRVYAMMPILFWNFGAASEYTAIPQSLVAPMPSTLTMNEAAALPLVSLTVCQGFDSVIKAINSGTEALKGSKIFVTGGSGGVGSFAVQYAKHVLGAAVVATTCRENKADFVRGLGADIVIDYQKERFEDIVQDYDVVFDVLAYEYQDRVLAKNSRVIRQDGKGHYVHVGGSDPGLQPGDKGTDVLGLTVPEARFDKIAGHYLKGFASKLSSTAPKYHVEFVTPSGMLLRRIKQYVEEGKVKPVVGKVFKFEEFVNAHDEVEAGHSLGKVVVSIAEE